VNKERARRVYDEHTVGTVLRESYVCNVRWFAINVAADWSQVHAKSQAQYLECSS